MIYVYINAFSRFHKQKMDDGISLFYKTEQSEEDCTKAGTCQLSQ